MNSTIFLTYLCISIGSNFEEVNVENNLNVLCIDTFLKNDAYDETLPYDKILIKNNKYYESNINWMFKCLQKDLLELFLCGCSSNFKWNNDIGIIQLNVYHDKLKIDSFKICRTYCVKSKYDLIFALHNYQKR